MEIGIFIPLILTILILLFVGIRQHRTFSVKENTYETRMRQMERSFAADRRAFETDRRALIQNEKDLIGIISTFYGKEAEIQWSISPPEIFPNNPYWKALSFWLRREKQWCYEK